jgi:serine/threonine protein kinase
VCPKRNILVTDAGNCLVCDFGLSRIRHEISRTHTTIRQGGQLRFVAPEIRDGEDGYRINEMSDIYSLAMTIYTLGTRSLPYENTRNDYAASRAAAEGRRPSKRGSLGGLPMDDTELLWSLMESMWNHNPQLRPTISRACGQAHAIFRRSVRLNNPRSVNATLRWTRLVSEDLAAQLLAREGQLDAALALVRPTGSMSCVTPEVGKYIVELAKFTWLQAGRCELVSAQVLYR